MTPLILRIVMIAAGCFFLILNFVTYVRKNLTEKFTWLWTLFALVMILSGVVPGLYDWSSTLDKSGFIAVGIMAFLVILFLFIITKEIAELKRRNKELAMHVSLLNQENERILARLEKMAGVNKSDI